MGVDNKAALSDKSGIGNIYVYRKLLEMLVGSVLLYGVEVWGCVGGRLSQ